MIVLILVFCGQFFVDYYLRKITDCFVKVFQIDYDSDEEVSEERDNPLQSNGYATDRDPLVRSDMLRDIGESDSFPDSVSESDLNGGEKDKIKILKRGIIKVRGAIKETRKELFDARDKSINLFLAGKQRITTIVDLNFEQPTIKFEKTMKKQFRFQSISDDEEASPNLPQPAKFSQLNKNLGSMETFSGMTMRKTTINETNKIEAFDAISIATLEYNPLEFPTGKWNALKFIILLPPNLFFFFLFPDIKEPVSSKKLKKLLIMCFGSSIVLVFLLVLIEYSIVYEFKLKPYLLSLVNSAFFVFK